jgi:outer membrane protein TolC
MGAERLLGQLKDLVEEANELLQISEQGFEAGALTLLESLEAARSLREIEEALLDARFRLATLDVNLLEAEGVLLEEGA